MRVSSLFVYPVKGLRGTAVERSTLQRRGLEGDRRWMVVDPDGVFITQRQIPAMATLIPRITADGLSIECGSHDVSVSVPTSESPRKEVSVWSSTVLARVAEGSVNGWLSERLGSTVQLVWMPDESKRPTNPARSQPGDIVSFADGYPVLVTTVASLAELNQRISRRGGVPVPMDRFRPNVVLDGAEPFAEDTWNRIAVGDAELEVTHGCVRCKVTTVDQERGEVAGKEPLATLATFREEGGEVRFGVNAIPRQLGELRRGDEVIVRADRC